MKKRLLALLLALVMVVALLPTIALAADSGNTLQFSTDLKAEYSAKKSNWGPSVTIAVGTYTPAGGTATALPAGTKLEYQWYWNTTGEVKPESDTKMQGGERAFLPTSELGIKYCYAIVTAEIDGVTYTGTTTVAKVIVKVPDITVTATVNNKGVLAACKDGKPASNISVKVSDLNLDGKHTYDEAMVALHTACLSADGFAVSDAGWVTKLWGVKTSNCAFYLNGKTFDTKVTETALKANDVLYASLNKDDTYYSDQYSTFDLTKKTIAEGVPMELTLTGSDGKALAGVQIGLWEDGTFKALEGKTTDENGKVSLSFETAGDYYVTASGTVKATVTTNWSTGATEERDCPLMAPACSVTVKKVGNLAFAGSFSEESYCYKVGETNTFSWLFSAKYDVDGAADSGVKITTSWYRLGKNSATPEKVEDINAAFTDADVGTWQYYMYAEGDAYGVKVSARSNFATVIVAKPTPLTGNSAHGYTTILDYLTKYNGETVPGFKSDLSKTDYTVTELDKADERIKIDPLSGKNLWYGMRVNGIRTSDCTDTEHLQLTHFGGAWLSLPDFEAGATNVVSVIIGTKVDSNHNGKIEADDDFNYDDCDIYNFTVTTLPSPSALTIKDADGNSVDLTPNFSKNRWATELYGVTDSNTIQLTTKFKTGNKLYVGSNDTAYTSNLKNTKIDISSYRDKQGTANLPLRLVSADGTQERTVTLHLKKNPPKGPDAPVIKTQPADAEIEKGTTAKLTVEAEKPAEGVTLSYQWFLSDALDPSSAGAALKEINGATAASYDAPAQERVLEREYRYYTCCVTATNAQGGSTSVYSNVAKVTTKLTYVCEPIITVQPGVESETSSAPYRTEYTAGTKFDKLRFFVSVDMFQTHKTEMGCDPFTVQCYVNTKPDTEGAWLLDGEVTTPGYTSNMGCWVYFNPATGLPEGEYYVYIVVTSTATGDPSKSASTRTNMVKLTYTPADYGFEGDGTESNPYLLKSADDFVTIQTQVNDLGNKFEGIYFKMANDITLPADWASIGSDSTSGKVFSGILDGDNHKLRYAKGSKPLFEYVSRATIQNLKLYGEEIQGCGLVNAYPNTSTEASATISNVTLLSGTSTLKSGLVQGAHSAANLYTLKNCVAEEGVVIGYAKNQSKIGTFGGEFVGTMENCRSAATVYGESQVGGLAGYKNNSMGRFDFKNCSFTGKIEATGNFVGGIAGQGYSHYTAPNATATRVENCAVSAEITGKSAVGGVFGGEGGIDQTWDNGIGYIRNNVFYGKLNVTDTKATEENIGGAKGGIIGYMRSLNRCNVIENNYFYDANGTTKAIGGVEHIDTSTHKFGLDKESNIFYYDTSRDSIADIKDWVDREDKDTADWQYTSVPKTNHNRTDDPMGKDSANLGKPCTVEQMKDGTVVDLLNKNENSQRNWEQGDVSPVISNKKTVTGLTISGAYKTEYYIGDELDLTGAIFTATWSDDSQTTVDLKDVTVTGFDSSARAVLKLTASYSGASCEFTVKILKKGGEIIVPDDSITVYFTLLGDEKHGEPTSDSTHTLASDNLTPWLEKEAYKVDLNATVWDLMQAVAKKHSDVSFSNPNGNYVDSVTYGDITLAEFDNGTKSGWMYTLNDKHPLLGVSQQFLDDGDSIVFHYTDDYTVEEGSEDFDDDHIAAGKVTDAINALPAAADITLENKEAVAAARAAFNALTEAQQALVSKEAQDKLTACEARIAELEKPEKPTDLPFTDLTQDWYMDSIRYVYEHELMYGTTDTTFAPDDALTRGMFVTMLYRMEGKPEVTGSTSFTDVPAGAYYADAVAWASANGVVYGTSETAFSPEGKITREQMAAMMRRYASFKKLDTSAKADLGTFADASAVSAWATGDMQWAVASELLYGNNHNQLQPTANATRAQAAAILQRFATKIVK